MIVNKHATLMVCTGRQLVIQTRVLLKSLSQKVLFVFQDKDENGKTGGVIKVPIDSVAKGEVPTGLSFFSV